MKKTVDSTIGGITGVNAVPVKGDFIDLLNGKKTKTIIIPMVDIHRSYEIRKRSDRNW
ncbi:MAG: hypothetical protein ACLS61_11200 [Ruminococcus sp.]